MIIKTCDRCGIEIRTNPMMGIRLPKFSINRIDGFPLEWKSVDLCPRCEKELAEWLNNNEKGSAPHCSEGEDSIEPECKMGRWLDGHRVGYGESLHWYIYCSECLCERDDDDHDKDTPYCPNCGARMTEGGLDGEAQ